MSTFGTECTWLVLLALAICTTVGQYITASIPEDQVRVDYFPQIFPTNYLAAYSVPNIDPQTMERALQETEATLASKAEYEDGIIGQKNYLPLDNYVATTRHQLHHLSKPNYMFQSERFDGYLEVLTQRLKSNLLLQHNDVCYGLPQYSLEGLRHTPVGQWCEERVSQLKCDLNSPYRNLDGTCNNPNNPTWGRSFSCFQRLLPPDYADDISAPRVSKDGNPLPNTRILSTYLHGYQERTAGTYTHLLMQWGQFMDHDFTFTKPFLCSGHGVLNCCPTQNQTYGPGPYRPSAAESHPQCWPIQVPVDDYFYSKVGKTCINFVRSAPCSSCTLGPRQQTNQVTSLIDASPVYGNSKKELNALRDPNDRALMLLIPTGNGQLLPNSRNPNVDQCSRPNQGVYCFSTGDVRSNQHPGLVGMQTVFARYHNVLANRLKAVNPHWQAEQVFQETRRIVIAQTQFITYREYIHLVVGPSMMTYFDLWPQETGRTTYSPNLNPTLFNEFAAAAYRYGHSLVSQDWLEISPEGQLIGNYNIRDHFFNPTLIRNGSLDFIINGLCKQPAQSFDRYLIPDLTNYIYRVEGFNYGLDLAAINNQRCRDHGCRGYTSYLKYCFDVNIGTFDDLRPFISQSGIDALRTAYRYVEDIDLWTGGLHEFRLRDAVVGPTFGCIIGQQYYHTKFGDRFFVEHGNQAGSFTDDQLRELRKTWLSKIFCLTLDFIKTSQLDVFQPISAENPELLCKDLPDIDINFWRDTPPAPY